MGIARSLSLLSTLAELELRRLRHDPAEVFIRAVQPALWLGVFGTVMSRLRVLPVGSVDYLTFITPGVMMQSSTFIALAYGMMLIWERESGILKKLLTAPVSRWSIVLGRSLAGSVRAATQLFIILGIALSLGARVSLNPPGLGLALATLLIGSLGFSGLSILIAAVLKTRERFMGIVGAITMPLYFASNAIYPVDIMPQPIKLVSLGNPLTYIIGSLRSVLVYADYATALRDMAVVAAFTALTISLAAATFRRIIE